MRTFRRYAFGGWIWLLVVGGFYMAMPGCSSMALSDEMNLRAKFVDFNKQVDQKRWLIEDQITLKERAFQDGLTRSLRAAELANQDQILNASDWKQAKRDYRDKTRNQNQELRQKIRVHREQFELEWLAIQRAQEKDMKDFLEPIENEFKKNRNNPAYEKASSDFDAGKDELKDEYTKWKERVKELKTPDSFLTQT
jgi:hypothetical protein